MGPGSDPDAVLSAYAKSLILTKSRQLCRKPGVSPSDEDDLVQDLTLSLLAKGGEYDPDRGASLDTFADRIVDSAVKMILRARRARKRAAGFFAQSLQSDGQQLEGTLVPLADLVDGRGLERRGMSKPIDPISALERKEAIQLALQALSPSLAAMARRRTELSVNALAKEMGTSRRQVEKAMKAIREKFEEFGLGDK
jgi:RNA polymerase sigma factor (sigma-70 family)